MPNKPKRPCLHIGCSELVNGGYCDKHKKPVYKYDNNRGNSTQRGYDSKWVKFRLWFLERNPLCLDCLEYDKATVPATDVHHIKKLRDGGEKLNPNNCRPLCNKHHRIRTNRGE